MLVVDTCQYPLSMHVISFGISTNNVAFPVPADCSSSCASCDGSADTCTSCEEDLYLHPGSGSCYGI